MKILIELNEGEVIPKGYGLAYHNMSKPSYVVSPIPLNIVIRLYKEIEWKFIKGLWKSKRDKELYQAYLKGKQDRFK